MLDRSDIIELQGNLAACFQTDDLFGAVMNLDGQVYREKDGRKTLRFEMGGQGYFAKIYRGVGWGEILKNFCRFRLPVIDAITELRAIRRLEEIGIDSMTVAGFGCRGLNPARRESFLITSELLDMPSLEVFCKDWLVKPPPPRLKWEIIDQVAAIARILHGNGINHRDFYLCHFLLDADVLRESASTPDVRLHLIDLHRVQIRRRTPERWVVKDLGGLMFSSLGIGLSRRDFFRFVRAYRQRPLRNILMREQNFWQQVVRRALKFYRRDFGINTSLPSGSEIIRKWA